MSDIQNIILDTSTGLIHKIKREHLYVHFNIVSGDSVIKIVSGDSVITIVSGFPCVLLFSSFYNLVIKFCSGGNLAYYASAFR